MRTGAATVARLRVQDGETDNGATLEADLEHLATPRGAPTLRLGRSQLASGYVTATIESTDPIKTVRVRLDPGWVRRSAAGVLVLFALFMVFLWAWKALGSFLFLLLLAWLLGIAIDPIVTRLHDTLEVATRAGHVVRVLHAGASSRRSSSSRSGSCSPRQISALVQAAPGIVQSVIDWLNQRFNLGLGSDHDHRPAEPDSAERSASTPGRPPEACWGSSDRRSASSSRASRCCCSRSTSPPTAPGCAGTWPRCFPPHQQAVFNNLWTISTEKAGGFVISRLGLAAISAFFSAIFFILIGLDYWLPLALWMGLISQFIPTVGTYLADRAAGPDRDPVRPAAGRRVGDHLRHGLPADRELLLRAEDQCQDHGHPSSRRIRIGHRRCRIVRTRSVL